MRLAILSALTALFLPACLGGGSSGTTAVQTAAMEGTVYEVDGQTVDRSGVMVRVLETGDTVLTGADGSFTFRDLPAGSYTLDFDSTLNAQMRAIAHQESEGTAGGGDGTETDGETGGDGTTGTDGDAEGEGEEHETEHEEEGEDHEGRPRVDITRECGRIVIRVALEDGRVKEFVVERHAVRYAKARLHAVEGSSPGLEGAVRIRSGEGGDAIKICVHGLAAGTVIEVCLDARDEAGPQSIGTATANGEGVACLARHTGEGDPLPLGAESVSQLEGHRIEVKVAGETVLVGEVPDLPEAEDHDCNREEEGTGEGEGEREGEGEGTPEEEKPHDGSARGKAWLDALVDGVEGAVEIRCWPAEELQVLRLCIHGNLEAETELAFEIQDPETEDGWVLLGTRLVREGEACFATENELPLGAESVAELVGLRVRVRAGDTVLLIGRIPELVRD